MASAARTETTPVIADEALVNTVLEPAKQTGVRRYFTIPGRDPFDEIEWEIRDAYIPGKDRPVFEQKGVEFPKFWSQNRDQHRRAEVLPRPHVLARARVERPPDD